ncbi:DUF3224 domain-containing protein [Chromobacterium sp. IIBBL 290-4]|uniref:DUF3224 domain-containing protein n=1 Tax=Chromobacterium sp. IIBBL 290-4 TaxID=2953890 RepID=UPI0020B83AB7|nr:DUF3224 domain-containing protein [Chromobacterium sp. IIBBL 290-4]UTH75545.1 DUF3224 domain-containing protein [Chromobacterium sp. IIBBL 290-4]
MASIVTATSTRFQAKQWQEQALQQQEGAGELKRASVVNAFEGSLQGEGWLEYQLLYPREAGGDVRFIGYERVVASWGDKRGSFVLLHDGVYSATAGVSGSLKILPGSGSGDFQNLSGEGRIISQPGAHGGEYLLTLWLD